MARASVLRGVRPHAKTWIIKELPTGSKHQRCAPASNPTCCPSQPSPHWELQGGIGHRHMWMTATLSEEPGLMNYWEGFQALEREPPQSITLRLIISWSSRGRRSGTQGPRCGKCMWTPTPWPQGVTWKVSVKGHVSSCTNYINKTFLMCQQHMCTNLQEPVYSFMSRHSIALDKTAQDLIKGIVQSVTLTYFIATLGAPTVVRPCLKTHSKDRTFHGAWQMRAAEHLTLRIGTCSAKLDTTAPP